MKNFTRISVLLVALVFSGSAFAQIPYKMSNQTNKIDYTDFMNAKKGTKSSRDAFSLYVDYGTANGDDNGYIWPFNSLFNDADTSFNFIGVSMDQIAGYTDPADPANSIVIYSNVGLPDAYPSTLSLTVDSIFAYVTHENNSAQYDYITMKIVSTGSNGAPSTNVLWQQTDSSDVSLSSNGNWLGTGAGFVLAYAPAYTTNPGSKVAFVIEYVDPSKVDSFGVLGTSVDDGTGGTLQQSSYKNSYMRYPPFIPQITLNSNVGYGNPVGADGWLEAQNWGIWARVSYDWNVGVNDVNNNLSLVSLSPNPAQNFVRANIELAKPSLVNATLTDVTGRMVNNVFNGTMNSGKNFITINTTDLAAGVYFVNISADNGNVVSTRVVVTK
ncbi:MAG: T9SS type A sorting domain-containing protein [Bacteroidota bacterium]|jgi:hypothetical protein